MLLLSPLESPMSELDMRPFPILGKQGFLDSIPWYLAEMAYLGYHRKHRGQTLERIAERGGFGAEEVVKYLFDAIESGDVLIALTPGPTR